MLLNIFTVSILIISAIFYYKFYNKIPILMYHRIADVPGDRNSLPPKKFEQQLQYLHSKGYTTINMDQLYSHYALGQSLPKKSVVLTFDDAYADNLYTAMPIMQKYNMIGNVFAITNWIGKQNKWENFGKQPTRTMNEKELLEWKNAGNYIGSHTCNHPFLVNCPLKELIRELSASKTHLCELTHSDVISICYPYGSFNSDVIKASVESGYKIGLAIFNNAPIWKFNLLALPRIVIPSGQKMWEFKLKVSKIHMIFIILRQLEKNLKKLFR